MKDLTREKCDEFKKNPSVNPLTGRKIKVGKVTHMRLTKECSKVINTPKVKVETKPTPKPKTTSIPPLGPMIHWNYKYTLDFTTGLQVKKQNATEFLRFIQKRFFELQKEEKISKSEFNDYVDMLEAIRDEIAWSNKMYDTIDTLQAYFQLLRKNVKLVDDLPKYDIVYNVEVHPSRTLNRRTICGIYNSYATFVKDLQMELKHKSNVVIPNKIKDLKNDKKYLDHMIKLKLFTYDDIYKNTFENENFPEEIAALYKKYMDKYYPNAK